MENVISSGEVKRHSSKKFIETLMNFISLPFRTHIYLL